MIEGTLQVCVNIENEYHQIKRDKKESEKSTLEEQTLQQKSHQRNKNFVSSPFKILWSILKIDHRGSKTNRTRDKKGNDDSHDLTSKR